MTKEEVVFDERNKAQFVLDDDGFVQTIDVYAEGRALKETKYVYSSSSPRPEKAAAIKKAKEMLGL